MYFAEMPRNLLSLLTLGIAMHSSKAMAQQPTDTAYRSMQERGQVTMGVDQATSSHGFEALPDGGRIALTRTVADSAGVMRIRAHIRQMQKSFSIGDFSMPMFIHMQQVPGAKTMAERHSLISYIVTDIPNGAMLKIMTKDPAAVSAIHEFLAFQRREHHADTAPSSHTPDHGGLRIR